MVSRRVLLAAIAALWPSRAPGAGVAPGGGQPAQAAAPAPAALTITGPASSVGDGETTVVLTASGDAAHRGEPAGELAVEVDAGSLLAVMQAGNGDYQINLVPPRVALPRKVNVVARLPGAPTKEGRFTYVAEPLPATLGASRSRGPLDIRGPRTLVLARTPSIEMSVGRPPNGMPAIHTSAGTVTTPERRQDDGRLYFRYVPPAQRFPQYAILAGLTPEGWTFDWMTIELHGMAQVNTRTKPGSIIVNKVAGKEYGPVRTGADGRAEMAVLTPPGVAHGTTLATDPAGNVSEKQLDFLTPPWSRILALCPRQGDSVIVLAVDTEGRAKEDETFVVQVSSGTVGELKALAAGVYEAKYEPSSGARGEAKVTIRIPGEPASVSSCTISGPATP